MAVHQEIFPRNARPQAFATILRTKNVFISLISLDQFFWSKMIFIFFKNIFSYIEFDHLLLSPFLFASSFLHPSQQLIDYCKRTQKEKKGKDKKLRIDTPFLWLVDYAPRKIFPKSPKKN